MPLRISNLKHLKIYCDIALRSRLRLVSWVLRWFIPVCCHPTTWSVNAGQKEDAALTVLDKNKLIKIDWDTFWIIRRIAWHCIMMYIAKPMFFNTTNGHPVKPWQNIMPFILPKTYLHMACCGGWQYQAWGPNPALLHMFSSLPQYFEKCYCTQQRPKMFLKNLRIFLRGTLLLGCVVRV